MENVVAIIQARMSSRRLPRKVALDVYGQPLLERVIRQVQRSTLVDLIVVATSTEREDDVVDLISRRVGVRCFRGSLTDVRSRFVEIGKREEATIIVRVTADNPFTEPYYMDQLITFIKQNSAVEYCTMNKNCVPTGTNVEAFRYAALLHSLPLDYSDYSKEHVTPGIIQLNHVYTIDPDDSYTLGDLHLSIDTFEEYLYVNEIIAAYGSSDNLLRRLIADLKRQRLTVEAAV